MWIAHLSDPHLMPSGVPYRGVMDSNAAFASAVQQVNELDPQPDLVVLTGDIIENGAAVEYDIARGLLSSLRAPFRAIPGNHDVREPFRIAFASCFELPTAGPLHYVDDASGPVRIVALDVTVPGLHHGQVDSLMLEWLDAVLSREPLRPTVLLMHQPPLSCGVPYLDEYRCFGGDTLEKLLTRYPAVERILCGHVHRLMLMPFARTLLCTAPSTAAAIALRPQLDAEPTSVLEPPGFLLHHWRDGHMLTHAIPVGRFPGPFPFA